MDEYFNESTMSRFLPYIKGFIDSGWDASPFIQILKSYDPPNNIYAALVALHPIHLKLALHSAFLEIVLPLLKDVHETFDNLGHFKLSYIRCKNSVEKSGLNLFDFDTTKEVSLNFVTDPNIQGTDHDLLIFNDANDHLLSELELQNLNKKRQDQKDSLEMNYKQMHVWMKCFQDTFAREEIQKLIRNNNQELFMNPLITETIPFFKKDNFRLLSSDIDQHPLVEESWNQDENYVTLILSCKNIKQKNIKYEYEENKEDESHIFKVSIMLEEGDMVDKKSDIYHKSWSLLSSINKEDIQIRLDPYALKFVLKKIQKKVVWESLEEPIYVPEDIHMAWQDVLLLDERELENNPDYPTDNLLQNKIWSRLNNLLLIAQFEQGINDEIIEKLLSRLCLIYKQLMDGELKKLSDIKVLVMKEIADALPSLEAHSNVIGGFLLEAVFQNIKLFRSTFDTLKKMIPSGMLHLGENFLTSYGWDLKKIDVNGEIKEKLTTISQLRQRKENGEDLPFLNAEQLANFSKQLSVMNQVETKEIDSQPKKRKQNDQSDESSSSEEENDNSEDEKLEERLIQKEKEKAQSELRKRMRVNKSQQNQ